MMYRTHNQVATEFIAEGKRRNITERGIIICIATGLVESNLTVYANTKVPESMTLPHDAVGSDGYSVGPLQQQVRQGNGGQWWWGPAAVCMDPTLSAGLFYDRLAKLDYNGPNSPGSYAQAVQSSAFPDRYDQRMADAQAIYDRLAIGAQPVPDNRPDFNEINEIGLDNGNHASARSRLPMNFFLHTQEGGGGDSAATDLSAFLRSTSGKSAVSYHYTISQAADGGVTVVDVVDTDLYSWAVLNANVFSINLCFAGSHAAWTRDQWMQQKNAIRVAAYIAVQDAKKYKFSTEVILPPYGNARQGLSDHRYVTECLGYGSHTDVGGPEGPPWTGFPWDYFVGCVNEFTNNAPVVSQPVPVTPVPVSAWPKSASDRDLLEYMAAQLGPGDPSWPSKGMTLRDKIWSQS
jgi:hypothetical protein